MLFLEVPATLIGMERTPTQVGRIVEDRRRRLQLGLAEASRAAGVDQKTFKSLETGDRWPRDKSQSKIEQALGWQTGSLESLRAGNSARLLSASTPVAVDPVTGEELFSMSHDLSDAVLEDDVDSDVIRSKFIHPSRRQALAEAAGERELSELLAQVSSGQMDPQVQERAQYLLDQINVDQLPALIERLSRDGKILLANYAQELVRAESIERFKDAVETSQESDAQGQADPVEKNGAGDARDNAVDATDGNQGSAVDPANESQSDYDLARGGDRDPGTPSQGREVRRRLNAFGEEVDPPGPEGGA